MKVHRMHHWRRSDAHARDRLIRPVGHRELDVITHACPHDRTWHLVTEGPGAELHAWCEFDHLVGGVEPDFLDLVRDQRLYRRVRSQGAASREWSRVTVAAYLSRLWLQIHLADIVWTCGLRCG